MLEQELLQALITRRSLHNELVEIGKTKKKVQEDHTLLMLGYKSLCEMQKLLGTYYARYLTLTQEVDMTEDFMSQYKTIISEEQDAVSDMYNHMLKRKELFFKKMNMSGVFQSYYERYSKLERLTENMNDTNDKDKLLRMKIECSYLSYDLQQLKDHYKGLFVYIDLLEEHLLLLTRLHEEGSIVNKKPKDVIDSRLNLYDYYYQRFNQKLTNWETNPLLENYFKACVEEYRNTSEMNENREYIKKLENAEHKHHHLAVGRITSGLGNVITLRCAICGEEVTLPLKEVKGVYYKNKNGGLLKKRVDRINALRYIVDSDYRKDSDIRPFKVKQKVHK